MAYSRSLAPVVSDNLTSDLVGIGMKFASSASPDPNIEDTLLHASVEGMENDDLRVLAVLVTWFGIHSPRVNASRLSKIIKAHRSKRVKALWSALASWQKQDWRFKSMRSIRGQRVDLLSTGTEFQLRRHGEDPRFERSMLRVPANVLRDRPNDVLSPEELARQHRPYHHRVLMGPSYRADVWATLEQDPEKSIAELARQNYASYATAWETQRVYMILGNRSSP